MPTFKSVTGRTWKYDELVDKPLQIAVVQHCKLNSPWYQMGSYRLYFELLNN